MTADLTDARLISAAQEIREAIRHLEVEVGYTVRFGAWPQNVAKAQRLLDALAAWDKIVQPDEPSTTPPTPLCRCGRPAVMLQASGVAPALYCPSCEYGPVETCDCDGAPV